MYWEDGYFWQEVSLTIFNIKRLHGSLHWCWLTICVHLVHSFFLRKPARVSFHLTLPQFSADPCHYLISCFLIMRIHLAWSKGKWCIYSDYDGFPGSGTCWYGLDDARPCRSDQMYVARCGSDYRQAIIFEVLDDGEVLIKLGNGENKCWERNRREIFLRTCDQNNSLQRWFAPNGSFSGSRFELSQRGYERQCVSTAHHPKAGEVVELHSCEALRRPDFQTSYWNRY